MLEATIDASELVIEFQSPPLPADRIRVDIDATIETEPQACESIELSRGEELHRDEHGLLLDLRYDDEGVHGYVRRSGAFHLTDHEERVEGAQGNVSIEISDTGSGRPLTHLTILAIGPAPRTTTTRICDARESLHAPASS